jgi:hypothetical protein
MNTRTMTRVAIRSLAAIGLALFTVAAAPLDAQPAAPRTATAPGATTTPTTAPASTRPAGTGPTTAPPPPPVVATAPLPSPKAVALAFAASLEKGDADVARGLVAGGADRTRWVDAAVALSAALKRLDAAASARFGDAGRAVSQGQLHLVQSLKALEQAQEKVDGDAATLTLPGVARPLRLARTSGRWQLLVPGDGDVAGQVTLYGRLTRAADATAGEIAGGSYADAAAAARAFAARVTEARLGG